ncbi:ABC transporter [Altericroceibacterium endophyticum]|uniref:ABC transporter n=1 Tax=Altericroceibacterium endophyticum TaxID=1808508 RepID=A0A6I4T6C8_9SPHN|nr:ABC transporter [Altericroceibacterium endophyticum]MXO66466.1 ABC transporter [Altericroceibacterium endophyticum]
MSQWRHILTRLFSGTFSLLLTMSIPGLLVPVQTAFAQESAEQVSGGGKIADEVAADPARKLPELGLMGTVPIYWGNAASVEDALRVDAEPHWARAIIERSFHLKPISFLDAERLKDVSYLLLAQPRILSPQENVALDDWVRGGGRLLLFADPMMTGHSPFGLGDPRRPQGVILLSPIFDRWGLELLFTSDQQDHVHLAQGWIAPIPIFLAGEIAGRPEKSTAPGACKFAAKGVLALCEIGAGHVTILADSVILDDEVPEKNRIFALEALLGQLRGESGDIAGEPDS